MTQRVKTEEKDRITEPGSTSNYVRITGVVDGRAEYSHEVYAESFYCFNIRTRRLSGAEDVLPVTVRAHMAGLCREGERITLEGQLRSYNVMRDGRSHLVLKVFARRVFPAMPEAADENRVLLQGYLCKAPVYRTTPFYREISDILLAVNRAYGKSDYIPCICWGHNARLCSRMSAAQYLITEGRLQSRIYEKHTPDGAIVPHVAYEVSLSRLLAVQTDGDAS